LPWEFSEQIRSSIQPFFAYVIIEISKYFSLTNPYYQVILMKVITAIFSVLVINYFVNSTLILIEKNKIIYRIISFTFWFIPIISIRFSSETWSSLFIILALAYFQDKYLNKQNTSKLTFLIIGVLFGISFLFRYQIIFIELGVILWLLFYKKENIKSILLISLGGLLVFGFGVLIDYWFYGEFVISFWNYFYSNIIEDIAANFGTKPWYYYIVQIWEIPIYGVILLISFVLFAIKKYNSVYFWAIIPFFVIHSIIGHKEFRFIFPLAYFTPLILIISYNYITTHLVNKYKFITLAYWFCFISLNIFFISVALFKGEDDNGRHKISKYLYNNYRSTSINLISTPYSSPYSPFNYNQNFYLTKNIIETKISTICELDSSVIDNEKINFFVTRKIQFKVKETCNTQINKLGFVKIKQSIPIWVEDLITNYYDEEFSKEVLVLYIKQQ